MNPEVPAILHEIHQTRLLMEREKDVLKTEANPVHRVRRSWHRHRSAWIGGAAAVVGVVALAVVARARKRRHLAPVRTRYVMMGPPPAKKSLIGSILGLAAVLAKPAVMGWIRQRVADQLSPQQPDPSFPRR